MCDRPDPIFKLSLLSDLLTAQSTKLLPVNGWSARRSPCMYGLSLRSLTQSLSLSTRSYRGGGWYVKRNDINVAKRLSTFVPDSGSKRAHEGHEIDCRKSGNEWKGKEEEEMKMWKSMCVCKSLIEQIKNTISSAIPIYLSSPTHWQLLEKFPLCFLCSQERFMVRCDEIESTRVKSNREEKPHTSMCVLEFSNIIHLMRFVLEIFIILSRLPKMRIWKDTPVHPPLPPSNRRLNDVVTV